MHHQFVANALTVKLAHEMMPESQVGCMIARFCHYGATCNPKRSASFCCMMNNIQIGSYTDVMARGEYPKYMDRYFSENNIQLKIQLKSDKENIKRTIQLTIYRFSYYFTQVLYG